MAQLKSTNITGNLAVTGNILASKIIKLGGTADQILCADGTITTLSGLGAGTVTSVGISNGGGLSVSGSPITGAGTITISHADTSSQASMTTGGRTYVNSITLDTYGHVTAIGTGVETVTDYSLPLAANGTRGGIQIGFTSTDNNRALLLSNEKAYISLPTRLADYSTSGYGDANDATAQGWHYMTTNATNRPPFKQSSNKDYRIMSTAYSSSWVQQIATDFRGNDMFLRRKENGTWKPWTPIVRFQDCTADHAMQTITDNAIARWDSGGTAMLQNSGATIDDSGNITATSFKKSGGTDDDILMGNGSTISKQGLIDSLEAAMGGDTNTTYSFTSGNNGFTVTPSVGSAQTVGVTATKIYRQDTRSDNPAPYQSGYANSGYLSLHLKSNSTLGITGQNSYSALVEVYPWADSSGGSAHQLAFGTNGAILHRYGTSTWSAWNQLATQAWVEGKGYLTSHQSLANYVTLNSAQTISGTKTFTGSMKVSGRYANGGDDEGIIIGRASNSYAGLCLGEPSGLRSVFYLTSNNQAIWRYNNGTSSYDIQHPGKTGTIALTSDIPPGYTLPLAADGTRGGIQIGYSETENNRALKLNSEKAYIELPKRLYGGRTDATAPDSALKSGFYYTSSLPESLGFSSNQGTMFVSSYSDDWVAQMVIGCYTDKLAYRKKGTSWTNWKTVATENWVSDNYVSRLQNADWLVSNWALADTDTIKLQLVGTQNFTTTSNTGMDGFGYNGVYAYKNSLYSENSKVATQAWCSDNFDMIQSWVTENFEPIGSVDEPETEDPEQPPAETKSLSVYLTRASSNSDFEYISATATNLNPSVGRSGYLYELQSGQNYRVYVEYTGGSDVPTASPINNASIGGWNNGYFVVEPVGSTNDIAFKIEYDDLRVTIDFDIISSAFED